MKRPGRPRDPGLEARVLAAALSLYAEVGWSGFSFEAVARRAGVGKAPLYLRWSSREDLLVHALDARAATITLRETGDLRADLVDYTRDLLREKAGPEGWAFLRVHLEATLKPELHHLFTSRVVNPHVSGASALLVRAVERGDLPTGTPTMLLLDSLYGAIIMRMILTPPSRRPQLAKEPLTYAEPIVDLVLAGAHGLASSR